MSTESEIGYLKQHISNSEEPKTQAERIKKYVREVPEERRAEIQELFASLDKETIEAAEFLSTACRSILFSFDDSFVKSMEVKEEIFEILLEKGVFVKIKRSELARRNIALLEKVVKEIEAKLKDTDEITNDEARILGLYDSEKRVVQYPTQEHRVVYQCSYEIYLYLQSRLTDTD